MTNNAAPVFSNQYGHIYRVLAPCLDARWSHDVQEQNHKMIIECPLVGGANIFTFVLLTSLATCNYPAFVFLIWTTKEQMGSMLPLIGAAPLTDIQTVNFLRNGSAGHCFCQIATGWIQGCLCSTYKSGVAEFDLQKISFYKTDSFWQFFPRGLIQGLEEY